MYVQSTSAVRVIPRITALVIALCASEHLFADITYRIEPADIDGSYVVTGGSMTTDGTLGPLAASNIRSVSVDIRLTAYVGNSSGVFEVLDGSTTLDLTNATLAIEGLVEATPTGIQMDHATQVGESNKLSLIGNEGAGVIWSSAHYEFDLSEFGGTGTTSGFSHNIAVFAPPAGATFARLPQSGLIAQVVPEPSAMVMAMLGFFVLMGSSRRAAR
jgi:PEP-CTERM motif-containing protein